MKKRIVSAALALVMVSAVTSCAEVKKAENPLVETTSAVHTTAAISTTATKATTTEAPAPTTTVTEKITEIITTTVATATSKPSTTAPSTTLPLFDESKLDYYKKVEKAFKEDLRYGVFRRRSVTSYIDTFTDGTGVIVKQEIYEYYNRYFYNASFDDLLPAATENMSIYSGTIDVVFSIINGYREENGIKPLILSDRLTEIACARAEEIAWSGNHSHRRPNGKSCFTILKDAGIEEGYAGENIGWGYETAADVCEAWKNSETHLKNILDPDFSEIGIGVAPDPDPDGKLCWAQIFLGD
ncbi:MAG: CAP domain-containing protein [Clostridia bacterium]|nr:CAP domain-containing protein [Clostridia bacterium]